jgi:hypothetical protein
MDLMDKLQDLDKFGIDLKLERYEDEVIYCEILRQWFEGLEQYTSYVIDEREFGLEYISVTGEDSATTIYIKDSAIRFSSVSGDPYYAVMDVLEFIAKMHKEVVKLLSERAFEDPSEEIGQEESEEETSEDWDWI